MAAHRLISAKNVVALTRGVTNAALEVQIVVTSICPTRPCEFRRNSCVFDILGDDVISKQPIRICFYDEWATAASFVSIGDTATLKGFAVFDEPHMPRTKEELQAGPSGHYFITPCSGADSSALAVAQAAEQGDLIEVTVRPPTFEPTARVMKKFDPYGQKGSMLAGGTGKAIAA